MNSINWLEIIICTPICALVCALLYWLRDKRRGREKQRLAWKEFHRKSAEQLREACAIFQRVMRKAIEEKVERDKLHE